MKTNICWAWWTISVVCFNRKDAERRQAVRRRLAGWKYPGRLYGCCTTVPQKAVMQKQKQTNGFARLMLWVLLILGAGGRTGAQRVSSDSLTVTGLEDMGVAFTRNNSVTLLESGYAKFDDMLTALRQARRYIHLEYFNFRNDSIGNVLFDLLAEKAAEGVKVRALFDGYGNSSNDKPLKKEHLKRIRESGVEIYAFDPVVFPWINHAYHRDHRKIVVVDGLLVYTGGMNVADYYLTGRPEFGAWRDMHMRIEGDAVAAYEAVFDSMWEKVTGERLDAAALCATGGQTAAELFDGLKPDTTVTAGAKMLGVVDRIPCVRPKIMRKAYRLAIDNAQHHIQLINPYPTMVRSVKKALYRALERGVKVEFMVSSKSDIPISPDVSAYRMHKLMKRGADVYFYNEGFHHTKVMMVDSSFCTVGSANMNSRSFSYDYEVNAFIMDSCVTRQLIGVFDADKAVSTYLTRENWKKLRSRKQRLAGWFYHFLSPFL